MVAAFPLDISVFLSLPCASEVYLQGWNFLEGYPSQDEIHFTDIRQVRGGENVWKGPIVGGQIEKCSKALVRESHPPWT